MIDRNHLLGFDDEIHGAARRILEYLELHPHATDTVEGISRFWLKGDLAAEEVEDVVRELVAGGLVEQTLKPDGEWIYSHRSPKTTPEVSGAS